jgi:hypothetical protein
MMDEFQYRATLVGLMLAAMAVVAGVMFLMMAAPRG